MNVRFGNTGSHLNKLVITFVINIIELAFYGRYVTWCYVSVHSPVVGLAYCTSLHVTNLLIFTPDDDKPMW